MISYSTPQPACPVWHHVSTQILECQLVNNQAARAAASVAGGDGKFDGLSSKHGCFCHAIHCRGQQNGGNCPECKMRAQQGEIQAVVGPGQCPYNCSTCSCMCKVVFEEQHRHTISFALKRINLKENECSWDTLAMLSRIIMWERCSIATGGMRTKYSSITRMVDRTHLKVTRKMSNPSSTPRTKKRACIIRVALAERNQSFVSIIEDTLPACSQEALDVCMFQASLQE